MRTDAHWKKIGKRPHHGICLPLFAIRTKKGCGIGEFLDLIPLIEWCKSVGFDCLQLLPLNDSGSDPSPYNPLSSVALDPIYLSLRDLPHATIDFDVFVPYNEMSRLARYEVKTLKLKWLRSYFDQVFSSVASSPAYQTFLKENLWLTEYSRFMALKEASQGKAWQDWPKNLQADPSDINFHHFLQFLCFAQFKKVLAFASDRSILLIGDVPILLSPDSADVWAHPSLFELDLAAGAPPDKYNSQGQNWGFPLFDWDAMRKSGYDWWKQRLFNLAKLYHIYRIDHVVGFFRIWAIAHGKKTSEGSFIPSDPHLWLAQGRSILEMMIDASPLLPIAEDLGTIPPEVYPALKDLGVCGTKVLRWQGTTPYHQYEPFSMTTVSTPDMEPLALWWQIYPEEAKAFAEWRNWPYEPTLAPEQLIEILRDAHNTSSYFHVNLLDEYLSPFPDLRWPNPEDERINTPGTLIPDNWTFRFRPYLEELVQHVPLVKTIRKILQN